MRDLISAAGRPADPRLTALLAAAAAPAERPVPGEAAALAAYRAVMASPADQQRSSMKTRTTKLVAAGALSALTFVGGGYAVAATELPAQAADAATAALAAVGVTGPSANAADSATTHTKSATATEQQAVQAEVTEEGAPVEVTANDHGEAVSAAAQADYPSGRDRGAAVSAVAKSQGEAQRAEADSTKGDGTESASTEADSTEADSTEGDGTEETSTSGRATATERNGAASDLGADNADAERP